MHTFCIAALAVSLLSPAAATATDGPTAPYFHVPDAAEGVDALPLKSSHAKVDIAGVIAKVRLTQTYENEGKTPLEAVYVFPGSTKSAVFGMKMTIGERTITAKIDKREAARKLYTSAKKEGKTASLLEQERPNVFKMNVANILPGDVIKVEVDYTELVAPTEGVYEVVLPAVVGPRYASSENKENWVGNPYLRKGVKSPFTWDADVTLTAPLTLQSVRSPSHDIDVTFAGEKSATIDLKTPGGTKDYVVQYKLTGKSIATGLMRYEGEDENFFLLMMQPPERVNPKEIPAREYTFIVDVSGSMYGFPLDVSKKVLNGLISDLRPVDRFNLLFFAGGNWLLSPNALPATKENVNKALQAINNQRGGGSTQLLPALRRALRMEQSHANMSRTFVILTDGYVTVEPEAFEFVRNNLGQANMFAFGIGSSVNRHLIEGFGRVGMGESFVVMDEAQAEPAAKRFTEYVRAPVLTDAKVAFNGMDVYDVEPPHLPDLFASRPVLVFGKYKGDGNGTAVVTGQTPEGKYKEKVRASSASDSNAALRQLWARHRVATLSDLERLGSNDKRVLEVTSLGLKYELMTAFTSFVAVDQRVRNASGEVTTVRQPLPLPDGVEDSSVAGSSGVLSLRGTGRGGGGSAMGIGGLGTRGYGKGSSGSGHGAGHAGVLGGLKGRGKKAAIAKVLSADALVVSGYDKSVIDKVIKRHLASIQYCYEKELQRNAKLYGKVVVTFTIGADGTPTAVRIKSSSLKSRALEGCIVRRFKMMKFPAPAGEEKVIVHYPLLFKSAG